MTTIATNNLLDFLCLKLFNHSQEILWTVCFHPIDLLNKKRKNHIRESMHETNFSISKFLLLSNNRFLIPYALFP